METETCLTIRQSPEQAELYEAVSKMQGSLSGAEKGADNPFFKSKYADLASVIGATREHLAANGLAIVQFPAIAGDWIYVVSRLCHKSGQWMELEAGAKPKDFGPQSVGSVITYLRRYAWQSMTGLEAKDDDGNDGQGLDKGNGKKETKPEPKETKVKTLMPGQRKKMNAIGTELYGDFWDEKRHEFSAYYGHTTSNDLTHEEAGKIIATLEKRLADKKAATESIDPDNPLGV